MTDGIWIETSGEENLVVAGDDSVIARGNKNTVIRESSGSTCTEKREVSVVTAGKRHIIVAKSAVIALGEENTIKDLAANIRRSAMPESKEFQSLKKALENVREDSRMPFGVRCKIRSVLKKMDNPANPDAWESVRAFLGDADTLGSLLEHTANFLPFLTALF